MYARCTTRSATCTASGARGRATGAGRWRSSGPTRPEPWVEPHLGSALAGLTERQRLAVVLVHGFGWTLREVAELAGIRVTSVQNHLDRGLRHLRDELGVTPMTDDDLRVTARRPDRHGRGTGERSTRCGPARAAAPAALVPEDAGRSRSRWQR